VPLNTRDLWLVLRAQDQTNRALNTFARNVRNAGNTVALAQLQAQRAASLGAIQQARLATGFQRAAIAQQMAGRAAVMHGIATRNNTIQTERARIAQLAAQRAAVQSTVASMRAAGATTAQTSTLERQARALNNNIIQRRMNIATLQSEIAGLRGNVNAINQGINARRGLIAQYQNQIAAQQANIRNIDDEIGRQRALSQSQQEHERHLARVSQNMQKVGQTATAMGFALTAAGAVMAIALKGSIDTAIAYEKQVRLTATQVDNFGGNLEELADIGRRVAKNIAVPFETIQPALFDIFSSMEVNVQDAEKLLTAFSKAAVAGQVEIQDVSRATIGLLNAFQRPASDVNKLLDIQFQLVQEGVGSYEEWNQRIGLVTPSAVRAGQSIEVMMAALAASTRMGMSAARSGTAVARAFDALSNPKTVANLKKLGVEAQDASGKFRPFNEVLRDFRTALMKIPEKDRLAKMLEVFQGAGGTIEARRFLQNMLLGAGNLELFDNILDETSNSAGSMEKAYSLMANSAAANSQMLANQWNLMKESLGKALIPTFALIVGWVAKLVGKFNELSPRTKQLVAYGLALASAFSLIMGPLLLLIGIIAAIVASFVVAGSAIAVVVGGLLAFVALAAGAAAAFVLLWKKSEGFRNIIKAMADQFVQTKNMIVDFAKGIGDAFKEHLEGPFGRLWAIIESKVLPALLELYQMMTSTLFPKVKEASRIILDMVEHVFTKLGEIIDNYVIPAIERLTEFWQKHKQEIQPMLNVLAQVVKWMLIIGAVITGLVVGILIGVFVAAILVVVAVIGTLVAACYFLWQGMKWVWEQIKTFGMWLGDVFVSMWESASSGIVSAWNWLTDFFTGLWDNIVNGLSAAWEWIVGLWTSFSGWFGEQWATFWQSDVGELLAAVFRFIMALTELGLTTLQFLFAWAWESIKAIWNGLWSGVVEDFNLYWGIITTLATAVWGAITAVWNTIWNPVRDTSIAVWSGIWDFLSGIWKTIQSTSTSVWSGIGNFIAGIWRFVRDQTVKNWSDFVNTISNSLSDIWGDIRGWGSDVIGYFSGLVSNFYNAGQNIVRGLINGITSMLDQVTNAIHNVTKRIADAMPGSPVKTGPLRVLNNGYAGGQIVKMLAAGMTAEMDRLQMTANLMGGSVVTGFGSSLAQASPNYGGAATVVQNITVNTQEIDPRKNSAELGFELVKVL
jgi:phage tail tape measure protein, TP901 family, core region